MATTRLMPLHTGKGRTVGQAISDIIDYTENPQKTDGGRLITSWQCDSRIADAEFLFTKNQYIQKTGRVRGEDDVIAYHLRQSFVPGEITPEDANRLGCELAKRFTKGNHAYIVCTHIDKVHDCHQLIIDPVAAVVVQRMFRWASEGAGLNTIAVRLNEAGILTPSHYKKMQGKITHENLLGSGKWQTRTVGVILRSEVYTGDLVQGQTKTVDHRQVKADAEEWTVVRDTHEAIISREQFAAVQEILNQTASRAKTREVKAYTPNLTQRQGVLRPLRRQPAPAAEYPQEVRRCVLLPLSEQEPNQQGCLPRRDHPRGCVAGYVGRYASGRA